MSHIESFFTVKTKVLNLVNRPNNFKSCSNIGQDLKLRMQRRHIRSCQLNVSLSKSRYFTLARSTMWNASYLLYVGVLAIHISVSVSLSRSYTQTKVFLDNKRRLQVPYKKRRINTTSAKIARYKLKFFCPSSCQVLTWIGRAVYTLTLLQLALGDYTACYCLII